MTLADVVSSCVTTHAFLSAGAPLTFDDLVWMVRFVLPAADLTEIDAAARPFERGEPGHFTYEPIS